MFRILICLIIISSANIVLADETKLTQQIIELSSRVEALEKTVDVLTKKTEPLESEVKEQAEIKASQAPAIDPKSQYDLALASLKDGKFKEAEANFSTFISKYPKHKLRENAVFWYGESFYRREDFNNAAINYLKAYKEYPKGSKSRDSLLKLSLSLGALDKQKEACSILNKLDTEFPKKPEDLIKRTKEARAKFKCK